MLSDNRSGRFLSEINVTPFVDVMLVLLIIFMVTAPMMQEGVDVNLPQAKGKSLPTKEKRMTVTVTNKKKVYLNSRKVELSDLEDKLKKVFRDRVDIRRKKMIALQSFPDTPSSEPRLVWGVLFSFILHLVLAFALMGIPEFSAPKRTYFSSAYRVKLVDAPVSRRGRISVSKAGGKQGGKGSGVKASTKKSKKGITLSKKSSAKKGNVVRTTKRKPKKMDAGKAFSL
ncbi:MAG: biopolymer transporter ExbD, partial [Deltaproteobacteria bacterium]|nr:biopolymer transporter ExbD [Deltaproteobacteria bacterium]